MHTPAIRKAEFEKWMKTQVVASLKDYEANPDNAVPIEKMMERLRARVQDQADKRIS